MSTRSASVAALMLIVISAASPAEGVEPLLSDDFTGTVYQIGRSEIDVFQPAAPGDMKLVLHQKADIALIEGTTSIPVNVTPSFWRGDYIYDIPVKDAGWLTYTLPHQGQQLIINTEGSDAVKIILPDGYATGDRILGIPRPKPDLTAKTDDGLELIWQNTSANQLIEVGYYPERAPAAMRGIMLILMAAAVLIFIEYYASIRRLRAIREDVEGGRAQGRA